MKEVLAAIEKYEGCDDQDLLLWQHKVKMYWSNKDLNVYVECPIGLMAPAEQQRADK
jgi:hypothetical protein